VLDENSMSSGDIVFKQIYRSLRDALHPFETVSYTEMDQDETIITIYTKINDKEEIWFINKSDVVIENNLKKKGWFRNLFNI
jgi:hypothetical protein